MDSLSTVPEYKKLSSFQDRTPGIERTADCIPPH